MTLVALWALASAGTCGAELKTMRSARWAEYYARVYEVPVELVEAVIEVESNWDPHAVSPKGAVGLMQLMPATAARFGLGNRFDVQENIRGGVAYLAWLIRLFKGDLRLVVASYLAGESLILSRGLDYSSREVYVYVSHVARLYRSKRLARVWSTPQNGCSGGK